MATGVEREAKLSRARSVASLRIRENTEELETKELVAQATKAATAKRAVADADELRGRSRPHRPQQGLPPHEAQDTGLSRAGGRPLPDADDAHPRGEPDRPLDGPGAAPQRGPGRGDGAGPR